MTDSSPVTVDACAASTRGRSERGPSQKPVASEEVAPPVAARMPDIVEDLLPEVESLTDVLLQDRRRRP
jgi:hypothetical protein